MSVVARRYYDRGLQALRVGDLEGAIEGLRAAVDLAPQFATARIAFAVALSKYGDHPRAAMVARAGISRATSPTLAGALQATLGDVLTAGGDFLGAEDAFRLAAAVPGYEVRAAAGLARVYAKQHRFADSFAQLRRAAGG